MLDLSIRRRKGKTWYQQSFAAFVNITDVTNHWFIAKNCAKGIITRKETVMFLAAISLKNSLNIKTNDLDRNLV